MNPATKLTRSSSKDPLQTVLFLFVGQLAVLILLSFALEVNLTFVHRIYFQYDFSGYYAAIISFMAGNSPYPNMFSPPSALIPLFPFGFLGFRSARVLYFVINVGCFLYALTRFGREIGLEQDRLRTLRLITLLYFPFLMLADRGNVDGLLVSFTLLGFVARRSLSRGFLIGLSVGMKLYSGLLLVVFLRRKEFRLAVISALTVFVLQIPFLKYTPDFVETIANRSSSVRLFGNLSPYLLFELFIGGMSGTIIYLIFWTATLAYRLVRDRSAKFSNLWVDYIPWMISLPLIVLPYEGVFLLPLLAVYAKRYETEDLSGPEGLLVLGFILTGFQPLAASSLFGAGRAYFELINVVGLALVMIAVTFASTPRPLLDDTGLRSEQLIG